MADSQRKTANLFDYSAITTGYRIQWITGNDYPDDTAVRSDYIPVSSGTYSCSDSVIVLGYDASKNYIGATNGDGVFEKIAKLPTTQFTILANSDCNYIKILSFYNAQTPMNIDAGTMLNTGSTPLPYEPYGWVHSLRKLSTSTDTITTLPADLYADGNNATVGLKGNMQQTGTPTPQNPIQPQECGDLETEGAKAGQYKIPISSVNTTTPVYLGEVESTRNIKKLVLTGEENWAESTATNIFYIVDIFSDAAIIAPICSHFKGVDSLINDNTIILSSTKRINIKTTYVSHNVADFKQYLQQQYAAGTPVCVWYVLAEPETGIVNEPLRKIGNYADTVSGITIPTIIGKDSFDVDTTLKPSEVSLTYHGWHDAEVKEWDGSEWQ